MSELNDPSAVTRIAIILGVPPATGTVQDVAEKLANLLSDNRHWREKANGTDAELVRCRAEIQELRAKLLESQRMTPKGGDRGELARQVKLGAKRMIQAGHPIGSDQGNGIMDMADLTLRLLGEEAPCVDEWLEMTQ